MGDLRYLLHGCRVAGALVHDGGLEGVLVHVGELGYDLLRVGLLVFLCKDLEVIFGMLTLFWCRVGEVGSVILLEGGLFWRLYCCNVIPLIQ